MHDLKDACKIAVVQATPVMFDADACVKKALSLMVNCTPKLGRLK